MTLITPFKYKQFLETDKFGSVEPNKATVTRLKEIIADIEESILKDITKVAQAGSFKFLRKRMTDEHYMKLTQLFAGEPLKHKEVIDISLFTTEGEFNILLMPMYNSENKLYLLSEGGNVPTLTRLVFKLLLLLFALKHRPSRDVLAKVKLKHSRKMNELSE